MPLELWMREELWMRDELWMGEPGLLTGFVEAGYGFGFGVVDVEDG